MFNFPNFARTHGRFRLWSCDTMPQRLHPPLPSNVKMLITTSLTHLQTLNTPFTLHNIVPCYTWVNNLLHYTPSNYFENGLACVLSPFQRHFRTHHPAHEQQDYLILFHRLRSLNRSPLFRLFCAPTSIALL